jgi:hypothetical protein
MSQQRSDFSRGLGLAALILGVFALLLSWVPVIGLLSLPVALIGLVLGGIGLLTAIKSKSFGMPGAGVFVCVLSFVIQMYTLAPIGSGISAANESFKSYDQMVTEAEQARKAKADEALKYAKLYVEVYEIESGWGENYAGRPAAVVGFKLRNFGSKDLSAVDVTAYFEDANGAVVSEHTFYPVLSSAGGNDGKPLRAGYIKESRYATDKVPSEWAGSGAIRLEITEAKLLEPAG